MPKFDADVDVDEFYEAMSDFEIDEMKQLLGVEKVITNMEQITASEALLKEIVYHLKYSDSTHLELVKQELNSV